MAYSMAGEDRVLEVVFNIIGEKSRFCVDLGACNGLRGSNTRTFVLKGWKSLLIDKIKEENPDVKIEFITAENIEELFKKYEVPEEIDLLSIDIDGNDYWIWKAITNYRPRVVIIEYNSNFAIEENKAIEYDPDFVYDGTRYYGASMGAMIKLGKEKGYLPIYEIDHNNIIFVSTGEVSENDFPKGIEGCNVHYILNKEERKNIVPSYCHVPTDKKMIDV
jgi:hypothetical protein